MTNNRKYKYDDELFTREDDISYYLLGLMVTDGCVYEYKSGKYYLKLALSDYDHMEKVRDLVAPGLKLVKTKNRDLWAFKAYSKDYTDWLIKNECVPRKTFILKFPSEIPEEYMRDFMRGAMDGDGSITYEKEKRRAICYYCSSSKDFILGINKYLDNLCLKYSVYIEKAGTVHKKSGRFEEVKTTHDYYRTTLCQQDVYKLLKFLYYDDNRLSLNRKQKLASNIIYYYENEFRDIKGENHYCAKLTNENVLLIRKHWADGNFKTKKDLIKYFTEELSYNISDSIFYKVISGKTYKDAK